MHLAEDKALTACLLTDSTRSEAHQLWLIQ